MGIISATFWELSPIFLHNSHSIMGAMTEKTVIISKIVMGIMSVEIMRRRHFMYIINNNDKSNS